MFNVMENGSEFLNYVIVSNNGEELKGTLLGNGCKVNFIWYLKIITCLHFVKKFSHLLLILSCFVQLRHHD